MRSTRWIEKVIRTTGKVHELKTWPQFFRFVETGYKKFEIRKNDRDYQPGDVCILHEYDPEENFYTGATVAVKITYVTDFMQLQGYVVFGFEKLKNKEKI